jgi:4-hydroxy-2-oxoheptanedioate aldolase
VKEILDAILGRDESEPPVRNHPLDSSERHPSTLAPAEPFTIAEVTTLRELWDRGEVTVGGWCTLPSAFSAELMARCGFDWLCIDTQHGLIGYDQLVVMLQAVAITGTPAFVRVPWNQPDHLMKALDAGAQGVIVPMVNSAEEARAAVAACRYPPDGYRSWGPIRASLGVPGYSPSSANQRVVVAVMIETPAGVAAADEIVAVPGVDAVYIGPNDLAVTHGLEPGGDTSRPERARPIEAVLEACVRRAVVAGIHCASLEIARHWGDKGFRMLNVNSDALFLRQQATSVVQGLSGEGRVRPPAAHGYA